MSRSPVPFQTKRKRPLSPAALQRLRFLVASEASVENAARLVKMRGCTIQDALSGGTFRADAAERIEKRIDQALEASS